MVAISLEGAMINDHSHVPVVRIQLSEGNIVCYVA